MNTTTPPMRILLLVSNLLSHQAEAWRQAGVATVQQSLESDET